MNDFEQKRKATAERLNIDPQQIPRNIAIIMDGNGRWAHQRGMPRVAGHSEGAETAEIISQHCADFGIESLTLYSFSIENWKRPAEEVNALMHLYSKYLVSMRPTLMKNQVRLIHLGRLNDLPETVVSELNETIEMTSGNTGMTLALALNYGGRTEIIDAVRAIAEKCKAGKLAPQDIDEACISEHLYTAEISDPDLLIRTASEFRVSNFLLWQISYSEFYITDTHWPDFRQEQLEQAILAYAQRDRRFGNIKPI